MLREKDQIGPYTLTAWLGRGQFKEVWLAERKTGEERRQFALAVPIETYPDVELLEQEFAAWQKASGHPNVLPLLEMAEYDGLFVFVSEYASGGTLEQWLKQHNGSAPSPHAAIKMMEGILAGLEHLHAIPMLHRDLKPANVLLQNDQPRLTDFGIARLFETTFQTEMFAGTYAYMSPEALNGCYSRQADLWSAGVMLYMMLQGKPPFQRKGLAPLIRAIQQEEPEPLPASVPAPLAEIVSRSLSKDPARRFPDAATMRFALSLLEGAVQTGKEFTFPDDETTYLPISGQRPAPASAEVTSETSLQREIPLVDKSLEPPVDLPSVAARKPAMPAPGFGASPPDQPGIPVPPPAPSLPVPEVEKSLSMPASAPPPMSIPPAAPPPAMAPPSYPAPNATPARQAGYGQTPASYHPQATKVSPLRQIGQGLLAIVMLPFTLLKMLWDALTGRREDSRTDTLPQSRQPGNVAVPPLGGTSAQSQLVKPETTQEEASLVSIDTTLSLPSARREEKSAQVLLSASSDVMRERSLAPFEPLKRNPIDGAEIIWIPGGEFLRGSGEREDEQPPRRISLQGYSIYRHPVTVAQYRRFCEATGRQMPPSPYFQWQENQPMVNVSWLDAFAYCRWAGGRLPTEAQWEKAARGTDGRVYPWGNEWDKTRCANSEADADRHNAAPVGSFPQGASPYGVEDMAGNVWEWCADWYEETTYQNSPDQDPVGPDVGFSRVLRGGSWLYSSPDDFRAARRHKADPQTSNLDYGFRCVLS